MYLFFFVSLVFVTFLGLKISKITTNLGFINIVAFLELQNKNIYF